ncbi:AAA family ATPase [Paenactinomyces guangxiensis]|uniref:Nuclease SbcCD subunit C n=1 Tax=Paenactinomyces guangxiensis TaxID=1490290 RepID=A0A7W2A8Q6_9BACL|nr:AAA family ATPase [Paenactinomyces guangxiensis]MBA4494417.1 AAA family ATPase [Paenactinomyces guangxiensis]MBH8591528.1 AAA family ATPase [Paenactinomyces guangxiensis]
MNHFKKLIIENFQSHQYTEIDFSQGLNVFVGASDSGKSAVLRALRWVLFNQPRGTDFIRTGANQCRVSLTFADGTEVVRVRSSSINRYLLRTTDGEEKVFEGWGTGVPREITDVHGIQVVKLDQKEIYVHFGTQLESPFLLFESDRNKAKTIGRISGAHIIDNALKKTSSDRQATNTQIRQLEQQAEQMKEKLKPYENLPLLEQALEQTEAVYIRAKEKKHRFEQLQKQLHKLQAVRTEKQICQQVVQQLENLPLAEQMMWGIEGKGALYHQLARLLEKKQKIEQEQEICFKKIEQSQALPQVEGLLSSLEQKQRQLIQMYKVQKRWQQMLRQRQREQRVAQQLVHVPDVIKMTEKMQDKLSQLKSFIQLSVKWKKVNAEIQHIHHIVKTCEGVPQLLDKKLPDLEQKLDRLHRLRIVGEKWADTRRRVGKGKQFCREKAEEMARLTDQWAGLLKQLERCPTCGSHIDSSVLEHIMEEYRGGSSHAAAGRED